MPSASNQVGGVKGSRSGHLMFLKDTEKDSFTTEIKFQFEIGHRIIKRYLINFSSRRYTRTCRPGSHELCRIEEGT